MAEQRRYTQDEKFVGLAGAYGVKSHTRPNGTRGEGVYVGIVDTGVNILHDAFMTRDATPKSRIAWLWVIHGPAPNPMVTHPWTQWGTVFTNTQLDQIIAKVRAGKWVSRALVELGLAPDPATAKEIAKALLDLDEDGAASDHGTGVASIAAGTPWRRASGAPLYGGVAPDAKLIVVGDATKASIEAIEFCFDKAGATPCVVNMSLASFGPRHDGKGDFHRRVSAALGAAAGRAMVVSAGNAGQVYKHARITLPASPTSPTEVTVSVPAWDVIYFVLYLRASAPVKVSIAPPPGVSWVHRDREFFESGSDHFHDDITPDKSTEAGDVDDNTQLRVEGQTIQPSINPHVYSGDWILRLERNDSAIVDVWLSTNSTDSDDNARLVPPKSPPDASREDSGQPVVRPKNWIQHSLSSEACGVDVIAVGGISAKGKLGLYKVSSRGQPTDTRRAQDSKPDLAAPGVDVRAARWRVNGKKPIGRSTVWIQPFSGTSAAAPWVTGAVALMLSHDPALKFDRIREILRTQSASYLDDDEITGGLAAQDIDPLDLIGPGVLDIEKTLREVTKNNPP
jgi:subtilisin family serine protease